MYRAQNSRLLFVTAHLVVHSRLIKRLVLISTVRQEKGYFVLACYRRGLLVICGQYAKFQGVDKGLLGPHFSICAVLWP